MRPHRNDDPPSQFARCHTCPTPTTATLLATATPLMASNKRKPKRNMRSILMSANASEEDRKKYEEYRIKNNARARQSRLNRKEKQQVSRLRHLHKRSTDAAFRSAELSTMLTSLSNMGLILGAHAATEVMCMQQEMVLMDRALRQCLDPKVHCMAEVVKDIEDRQIELLARSRRLLPEVASAVAGSISDVSAPVASAKTPSSVGEVPAMPIPATEPEMDEVVTELEKMTEADWVRFMANVNV